MSLARKSIALAVVLFTASTLTGCAGGTTQVVADGSRYPVSMSRGVRDADGSLLPVEDRKKVGDLLIETRAWGILYSAIDLNPTTDISEEVNREVARTNGDAVVNLSVKDSQCVANAFYPLTWLPIWPGCVSLKIHGDIIKKVPHEKAPAAPAVAGVSR